MNNMVTIHKRMSFEKYKNPEEENKAWEKLILQWPNEQEVETKVKLDMIEESEKVSLENIKDVFKNTVVLRFDTGWLFLGMVPWKQTDTKIDSNYPALAQVYSASIDDNMVGKKKMSHYILLEGPSIEGVQKEGLENAFALGLPLGYRVVRQITPVEVEHNNISHNKFLTRVSDKLFSYKNDNLQNKGLILNHSIGDLLVVPSQEIYETNGRVLEVRTSGQGELERY